MPPPGHQYVIRSSLWVSRDWHCLGISHGLHHQVCLTALRLPCRGGTSPYQVALPSCLARRKRRPSLRSASFPFVYVLIMETVSLGQEPIPVTKPLPLCPAGKPAPLPGSGAAPLRPAGYLPLYPSPWPWRPSMLSPSSRPKSETRRWDSYAPPWLMDRLDIFQFFIFDKLEMSKKRTP
jgi:hypothetical protein